MSFLFNKKSFFVLLFLFTIFFNQFDFAFAAEEPAQAETQQGADLTPRPLADGLAATLKVVSPILAVVAYFFSYLASVVLGIASYGFDLAIDLAVYGMSDFVTGSDIIKESWKIFRNIANIGIIFALIFIAISTILQFSGYEAKKLLSKVIIAALLMNFSFFFGAVIIDISNEMSITIYKEIKEETDKNSSASKEGGKSLKLGSYFYEKTQASAFGAIMQSEFDENQKKILEKTYSEMPWISKLAPGSKTATGAGLAIGTWFQKMTVTAVASAMSAISSLILAIVLFSALSLVIGRLVALILLLVVSPIAFASMVLPNTKKISEDWWKSVVGHSFFLPAFLLFIYVAVKIAELVPDNVAKITEKAMSNSENASTFATMINVVGNVAMIYGIIIGLFIAALMIAQKVSSGGSAAVSKISGGVSSAVGGTILGSLGWAGRNTIGAGSNYLADKFAKNNFATTRAGMTLLSGMKGVAKSGFDLRESKTFKGVASATGVGGDFKDTLAPQKDGYIGQQKRAEDKKVKLGENLSNDLTKDQEKEAQTRTTNMTNMISNDTAVITAERDVRTLQSVLKTAEASGNVSSIRAAQAGLQGKMASLETAKELVTESAAYKAEKEAFDAIKSARGKYGKNLENNPNVVDSFANPLRWIPSQRSTDKAAAKKIMKEKSESEKILEQLRRLNDKDK